MNPLRQLTAAMICLTAVTLHSGALCAYEQGTYFIYHIVEELEGATVAKRLAVESRSLVDTTEVAEYTAPEFVTTKKFKLDDTSARRTAATGAFKPIQMIEIDDAQATTSKPTRNGFGVSEPASSGFGVSQTSVFGD